MTEVIKQGVGFCCCHLFRLFAHLLISDRLLLATLGQSLPVASVHADTGLGDRELFSCVCVF